MSRSPQIHFPRGDYSITEEDGADYIVQRQPQEADSSMDFASTSYHSTPPPPTATTSIASKDSNEAISFPQVFPNIQQSGVALDQSISFPAVSSQPRGALYESADFPLAQTTYVTPSIECNHQQQQQQQSYPMASAAATPDDALYESIDLPMVVTDTNETPSSIAKGNNINASLVIPSAEIEPLHHYNVCQNSEDDIDEEQITTYLQGMEFPRGLIETIIENRKSTAKHYWLIDNSGSMLQNDGLRLAMRKGSAPVVVPCTRWKALQQSVIHHAEIAGNLGYVTKFQLLNKPGAGITNKEFTVGTNKDKITKDLQVAKDMIALEPDGVSLITKGLRSFQDELRAISPLVAEQGKKIYFVLVTDGLPSDKFGQTSIASTEQLMYTLRDFENYPIFFVIRLCTTDEETVQFYNGLDQLLERSVEVILDIHTEAKEIYKVNKWINYSLPIHWSREMGLRDRIFDLIDERLLTKEEMIHYLELVFGKQVIRGLPDALFDWKAFHKGLTDVVKMEGFTWDPSSQKLKHWVDLKALDKIYGADGSSTHKLNVNNHGSIKDKGVDAGGCSCSVS